MDGYPAAHALFYIYPRQWVSAKNKMNEVKKMVSDELRPDIGKKLFSQRQAELEQGLQQMAHALGTDTKLSSSADFFRDFINGFWDPYEGTYKEVNRRQESLTKQIRALESQLREMIGPNTHPIFDRYSELLMARNSTALDYAFLVGYQCAFRFLMMGLFPATRTFLSEEDKE